MKMKRFHYPQSFTLIIDLKLLHFKVFHTICMHQFGWPSKRAGIYFFFNLLQKEGGTQKEGVPSEKGRGSSKPGGNCADMFGPFLLNNGHKQRKYYDATFTCMSSRAVQVETTNSMSTDSFTLALRRLIS